MLQPIGDDFNALGDCIGLLPHGLGNLGIFGIDQLNDFPRAETIESLRGGITGFGREFI
jgi:hypothetical protein